MGDGGGGGGRGRTVDDLLVGVYGGHGGAPGGWFGGLGEVVGKEVAIVVVVVLRFG